MDGVEVNDTNALEMSFRTVVEAGVAAFPAASLWVAVTLMAGPSAILLTSIPEAVKVPPPQVGLELTVPPTVTVTVRPFSEQVPDTE